MESNTNIIIENESYLFVKEYKDQMTYRKSLNRLAAAIYGFDFEEWYQQGFWGDRYRPYSLVHNDVVVANISVNQMEFQSKDKLYHALQIGTVMTDINYRSRGLSKALMNIVLEEYEKECELIYLYANDTVLDFYPRFGFLQGEEVVHSGNTAAAAKKYDFVPLDLKAAMNKELLCRLVKKAIPCSGYAMRDNPGLMMFYLNSFLAENVYYCEELKLAAVAEQEGDVLKLIDIFCEREFDLRGVINSLAAEPGMRVTLGFTPLDTAGFECTALRDSGTTFFYKGNNFLKQGRFPELSHA